MIPVAGYPIYQAVTQVDLKVFSIRMRDIEDYLIYTITTALTADAKVCTHLTRVTAYGGRR
ncbi:MAG: hypothetical protein IKS24_07745 [Bacteroidaceae bacterium]|nr:hypothetical protein [Bacteroidaceae bacterium]